MSVDIIPLILHARSEATTLLRYSVDGGATIKDIPAGSTIHGALGGIILHIGGSFVDNGTTYAVEAKRSTITWLDKSNTATVNGVDCPAGIVFHNETDLQGAVSKSVTISYAVTPTNGTTIKFYVDIHV
ncbi:MAG: hypothetical protein HYZ45_09025 [Burkholderiales bacterium]|nr:hypothetical protein [Burkholderiales bacterium]